MPINATGVICIMDIYLNEHMSQYMKKQYTYTGTCSHLGHDNLFLMAQVTNNNLQICPSPSCWPNYLSKKVKQQNTEMTDHAFALVRIVFIVPVHITVAYRLGGGGRMWECQSSVEDDPIWLVFLVMDLLHCLHTHTHRLQWQWSLISIASHLIILDPK